MAELRGVHHVSINVADNDSAAAFYTDILGLKEIPRPDFGFAGTWLEMADGRQLHLLQVDDWQAPKGQHFAFGVDDLDAVRDELMGKGIKVSEPFEVAGVCRQSFLKDPCGNGIELNQQLAS